MGGHDRRDTLLQSYENAAVIVSAIEDRQLAHPTPCPGYDVAGLIDHLVEAAHRAAVVMVAHPALETRESTSLAVPQRRGQRRNVQRTVRDFELEQLSLRRPAE